jgi:hypothetical protein
MSLARTVDIRNATSNTKDNLARLGLICLLLPCIWNVWIAEKFFSSDGSLESFTKILIWMSDAALVIVGLLALRRMILICILCLNDTSSGRKPGCCHQSGSHSRTPSIS